MFDSDALNINESRLPIHTMLDIRHPSTVPEKRYPFRNNGLDIESIIVRAEISIDSPEFWVDGVNGYFSLARSTRNDDIQVRIFYFVHG